MFSHYWLSKMSPSKGTLKERQRAEWTYQTQKLIDLPSKGSGRTRLFGCGCEKRCLEESVKRGALVWRVDEM